MIFFYAFANLAVIAPDVAAMHRMSTHFHPSSAIYRSTTRPTIYPDESISSWAAPVNAAIQHTLV
jgi:hypothetical protein